MKLTNTTIEAETAEMSSRIAIVQLMGDVFNPAYHNLTPVQSAMACAVITTNLSLEHLKTERLLKTVLDGAYITANAGHRKWSDVLAVLTPVADVIQRKAWTEFPSLILDKPIAPEAGTPSISTVEPEATTTTEPTMTEPTPVTSIPEPDASAPTSTKRRRRTTEAPPTFSRMSIPELAIPTVTIPDINVSPTDPMSAMASAIAKHMQPLIDASAKANDAALLGSLKPVIDAIRSELSGVDSRILAAGSSKGGGVDAEAVAGIVDAKLHNGAGEIVRKSVSSVSPTIFSDVLAKAADAVASMATVDHSAVKLTAALTSDPDPNYAWTDDLTAASELIERASFGEQQNALLVGPTGCGKTDFAMQYAAKYKRPCLVMDCANLREAREWFGVKGVANGATYFRKSQFWLAVEAGNCVVILDEFNRAPDHVRNPLMPLLDHRRRSFVEEVGEMLAVGPRTVFFATMNEGLDYSGTHTTDRAMKNRFPRRIEIDYLSEKQEREVLLSKCPGLDKEDAKRLVELAQTIRSKATGFGGGLSETISTRQLIAAAKDFVIGGPKTFKSTVFAHFNADGGTDSERAQVVNSFQLKGYILS